LFKGIDGRGFIFRFESEFDVVLIEITTPEFNSCSRADAQCRQVATNSWAPAEIFPLGQRRHFAYHL